MTPERAARRAKQEAHHALMTKVRKELDVELRRSRKGICHTSAQLKSYSKQVTNFIESWNRRKAA